MALNLLGRLITILCFSSLKCIICCVLSEIAGLRPKQRTIKCWAWDKWPNIEWMRKVCLFINFRIISIHKKFTNFRRYCKSQYNNEQLLKSYFGTPVTSNFESSKPQLQQFYDKAYRNEF